MSINTGTRSAFREAIMEKGFYPDSVPPVFKVDRFHQASLSLGLFGAQITERDKPFALARYNETKRGNQRRVFSIPNPVFFIDCAEYLSAYRRQISTLLNRSGISRSKPRLSQTGQRAVEIDSFSEFNRERRISLSSSKYIVKTDISRFYHSIYTHSIPWAMHGKAQSKADRSQRSTQTFGNKFDFLVRQAQDQQTIGIPVGPDISRIIAELIGGAIDQEFFRQAGQDVAAIRLVDDVYIGASTIDEAHSLLTAYRDAIRRFELDINESKTRIMPSTQDLEEFWPVEIRRELEGYREKQGAEARRDLPYYLDHVIRKANANGDDGIIKFAIRKFDSLRLWNYYWTELEPFLVRSAVNFPHTWDYVARVVAWRNTRYFINITLWETVCRESIAYHAPLGNDSEVTWSLWLLKEIGASLPRVLAEAVFARCGPLPCLIILDLEASSRISGGFRKSTLYSRIDNAPMLSEDWVLSYEAERLFGYRLKTKNRNDYDVFGKLVDQNVSFYDAAAPLFVFQEGDPDEAEGAIEDRHGRYDADDEEEEDDDLPF